MKVNRGTLMVQAGLGLLMLAVAPIARAADAPIVDAEELGVLEHGSSTLRLQEAPYRLLGPSTELAVTDGRLSGRLDGRAYHATVEGDHVAGAGPDGAIDVGLRAAPDGTLDLVGTWDGRHVDLKFTRDAIDGRLVRRTPTGYGVQVCRLSIDEVSRAGDINGAESCLGVEQAERVTIAPGAHAALTRPEVALLMLAAFSAPAPLPVT